METEVNNLPMKLPICLLVDCSPSMGTTFWLGSQKIIKPSGALSMEDINEGLAHLLAALKNDELMEYVIDIAIIEFSGEAKTVLDFQTVKDVEVPVLETDKGKGGTSIGAALGLAIEKIELKTQAYQAAGIDYYCPWLILITDGQPTDYSHLETNQQLIAHEWVVLPMGIGNEADLNVLSQLSPQLLSWQLEEMDFFSFEYLNSLFEQALATREEILLARQGVNAWNEYLRVNQEIMSTTKLKVAGAAVAGKSHESKQREGQDCIFFERSKNQKRTVIALADGAGSCTQSKEGAELVTSHVWKILFGKEDAEAQEIKTLGEGEAENDNFDQFFADRVLAVTHLHKRLMHYLNVKAESLNVPVKELASTLLFVALKETPDKKMQFLAGHLGDGVIVQFKDNQAQVFSPPEAGEYAGSTYFVTSKDAVNHLRFYKGELKPGEGFMLFSDGVGDMLYQKQTQTVGAACANMFEWFDIKQEGRETQTITQTQVTKAIRENLEKVFKPESPTGDDCSLVLLKMMESQK